MIKFKLQELLDGRSLYWLSKETGIRWATLAKMDANNAQRVELDGLDRICEVLECKPGDLMVRIDRKPKHRPKNKSG